MTWLEDVKRHVRLDCGDNSCRYKALGPRGVRTNGGCRCAENNGKDVERFLLRNYAKALQKIEELNKFKENLK